MQIMCRFLKSHYDLNMQFLMLLVPDDTQCGEVEEGQEGRSGLKDLEFGLTVKLTMSQQWQEAVKNVTYSLSEM